MSGADFKKSMSQKLRMEGRDYSSSGWYFVTLGADYHRKLFGEVVGSEMQPNALGQLVERCWLEIPQHYAHVELGAWQLMPNHFHGIVRIVRSGEAGLGEVLNLFKGSVTREARKSGIVGSRHGEKARVWAPNYYDVICFRDEELEIRERYVRANPVRWALRSVPVGRIKRSRFKGNVELLKAQQRRALRVSRKASEAQVEALKKELAGFDGVVCSTFFSPGEKVCLKVLLKGRARIVWIVPMAMPEKIPTQWAEAFWEGRALWLSAFPDEQTETTRDSCDAANRWIEQFCGQ